MKSFFIPVGKKHFRLNITDKRILSLLLPVYGKYLTRINTNPVVTINISANKQFSRVNLKSNTVKLTVNPSNLNLSILGDHIRGCVSQFLPLSGIILLHASVISVDNKAYIFSGKEGAGKSTIRGLLSDYPCYGDDTAIVQKFNREWCVFPSTFYESSRQIYSGVPIPIGGIYFISHHVGNVCTKLTPFAAYPDILNHMKHNLIKPYKLIPQNSRTYRYHIVTKMSDLCGQICRDVDCYQLQFKHTSLEFWKLIHYT